MSAKKKRADDIPGASAVVTMPVADLLPYAANARTHSPDQVKRIAASIKEFGFNNPILIDGAKGIIAGHGRLEAARKLGLSEVPTIELGHLSDAQKRAYILADNRLALDAGWDDAILAAELKRLQEESFDVGLAGFCQEELDKLLGEASAPTEGLTDEDEVPEDAPAVAQRGQVWKLGRHRLMCGDSTSADDVAELMAGHHADMTFTSPPYNAGVSAKLSGNTSIDDNLYGDGYNDDQTADDYLSFISLATSLSLKHSRYAFWNIQFLAGNRTALPRYWGAFADKVCDVAVWDKGHAPPQQAQRVLNSRFEFIFVFTSDKNPTRAIRIAPEFRGNVDNVFELPPQRKNEFAAVHGATFPVAFPETFIAKFCPEKGSVMELFGGTGTTMIAAEKLGRAAFLMEIDPRYCDIIIARWEAFTGQKAELAQ